MKHFVIGSDGKFNHAAFGDELIAELNLISVNGTLYTYSIDLFTKTMMKSMQLLLTGCLNLKSIKGGNH